MRYKRIKRHNVYQHRDLDIPITGNLVGLVGPNGSGKSNLLLSMRECLTGEYHQDKDRIPSWGTESGFMEDTLVMTDGREIVIRREFPSGASTLTVTGDEKPTRTPSKVNARLLELLATEKSVLENIAFVGQEQISSILFARDGLKDRLAQKFFGIEKANEVEAFLAGEKNRLAFDPAGDRLPGLLARQKEFRAELATVTQALQDVGICPTPDDLQDLSRQLRESQNLESQITLHRSLVEIAKKKKAEIEGLSAQNAVDRVALAKIDRAKVVTLLAQHQAQFDTNLAIRRLDAAIATSTRSLTELGEAPCTQDELAAICAQVEKLGEDLTGKQQSMTQQQQILKGIGTEPICPTCGQSVDISRREPIEQAILTLRLQINTINDTRNPLILKRNGLQQQSVIWTSQRDRLDGVLTQYRGERAKLPEALHSPEPDPKKYQAMLDCYDTMSASLNIQKGQIDSIQQAIDENLASQKQFESIVMDPQGQYRTARPAAEIEADLNDKNQKYHEWFQNNNSRVGLESALTEIEANIVTSREAATANQVKARYGEALHHLRCVFHPDGAPRTVVTRNTSLMTAGINHYLAQFGARFTVTHRDGLNFDCQFRDGVGWDSELSVGQKNALAWAFRFAAAETFSSSVGLMTLDEPSATFDDKVQLGFSQVAEGFKGMAERLGMQFFISTHHKELAAYCDQIIKLKGDDEE